MSKIFNISQNNSFYILTWSDNLLSFTSSFDLIELSFNLTNSHEIGLKIKLNTNEYDILWIKDLVYFDNNFKEYSRYLHSMYKIYGVAFMNQDQAIKIQKEISKKYAWEILKK